MPNSFRSGYYEDVQPALTSDVPGTVINKFVQEMVIVGHLCVPFVSLKDTDVASGLVSVGEPDKRARHIRPVGHLK